MFISSIGHYKKKTKNTGPEALTEVSAWKLADSKEQGKKQNLSGGSAKCILRLDALILQQY